MDVPVVAIKDPAAWTRHLGYEPEFFWSGLPIVTSTKQFNEVYANLRTFRSAWPIVQRVGRGFSVTFDALLEGHEARWPTRGGAAAEAFCVALLRKRRVTLAVPPPGEWVNLSGFATEAEAHAAASVLMEAWGDNPCAAVRATAVLMGEPDPVDLGISPDDASGLDYLISLSLARADYDDTAPACP